MMSDMQRVRSHLLGLCQGTEVMFNDFADNGVMWTGAGQREARVAVRFPEPYAVPPLVQVALAMWDTGGDSNQRVDLRAEHVTPEGFELVFRTWADSRVARVRADWTAMGPLLDDEVWQV